MKTKLLIASFILVTVALIGVFAAIYNTYENSITGNEISVPTKVNILPVPPSNCTFHLYAGWNLVSFYCFGLMESIPDVMQPINGTYRKIFFYDSSQRRWESYNPDLPAWAVQKLGYMDRLSGYWVYLDGDADYSFSGYKKQSIIPLLQGWNLIGYPSITSRNITDSLSGIDFDTLETYNDSAKIFLVYINGSNSNDFTTTDTYAGYWIYSTKSQDWALSGS